MMKISNLLNFSKNFNRTNILKKFLSFPCSRFSTLNKVDLKSQNSQENSKIQQEKPKLKIKKPQTELNYLDYNIPFITLKKSKFDKEDQEKSVLVKSRILNYSRKKLIPLSRMLRGKGLNDAISICLSMNSKGSKFALEYLNKIKSIYDNENKHSMKRFYIIREVFVGSKKGSKMPFPRAKGRADIHITPLARINFRVAKIPAEKYLQEIALGKADMSFSEAQKCELFNQNASLADIKKQAFFLTSRGRNYRFHQFKRLIYYLRERYYKSHKITLSKLFIAEEIKKNLGTNLLQYMNMTPISDEEFNTLNSYEKANTEIRESFYDSFVKKLSRHQENTLDLEKKKNIFNEKMRNQN